MRILTIIIILLGYAIAYSQPQIQIEGNDVYDWGKIDPKGKSLTAKVKIFNKGNETLKITEVKPGCGCTTAPLDKNDIEPNGFATLSITLNVSNDGPVQKSIRINSNDPKAPIKHLTLKADIVRPIGLSRKFLNFGNLELDKETQSSVTINNNTNKDIHIKDIITEPKDLVLNINKNSVIKAQKELILEIKYTPKNSNNLSGKVSIKTDNKEMESFEISIWGRFPKEKK
ncbi:MAG: DUF1573 domain-containing protein [bacterium]